MREHYRIDTTLLDSLKDKYQTYKHEVLNQMNNFINSGNRSQAIKQSLGLHALGIEREYLNTMYRYRELPEEVYVAMIHKFDHQIYRLEKGMSQTKPIKSGQYDHIKSKIDRIVNCGKHEITHKYMQYRAQNISSYKVLEYFKDLKQVDL